MLLLDEILRRDAFVFHHAADGFGQHTRHGEFFHLGAIAAVGDAVGEYHLFEGRVGHAFVGRSRHDAVAGNGITNTAAE